RLSTMTCSPSFFSPLAHRALHSFPTRRSSDLVVAAGADAIGLVFYEASPRNVDLQQAKLIARSIPGLVTVVGLFVDPTADFVRRDRKSTRLNSSHVKISYAVFCLKKKNNSTST